MNINKAKDLYSVKQEANLAHCIQLILETNHEIHDTELSRILAEKYQHETTGNQRKEAIHNCAELVNAIEYRTTSDGKLVYSKKDELTIKADKAGLDEIELEIFKMVKNSGTTGATSKWMKEKLQIGSQKEVTKALRQLQSCELIAEETVGRKKYYRRPDVQLDETITGGFWKDEDDPKKFDFHGIDIARQLAAECLGAKLRSKKDAYNNGNGDTSIILFGEQVGCSIKEICKFIYKKDIFTKPPSEKDLREILETMRYDDLVNCVRNVHNQEIYYLTKNCYPGIMGLVNLPCSNCSLRNVCRKSGNINPVECGYLEDWLDK